MNIETFYDERTSTLTYIVFDPETKDAVVIDPVLDYDPVGSKLWTESVDLVITYLRENDLKLHAVLETHAHADHLSGAKRIKAEFPDVVIGIGKRIVDVQRVFKTIFDLPLTFRTDGSQFDRLFEPNEEIKAGSLTFLAIPTPGHTPACSSYKIDGHVFTGDTLFQPDVGSGRCDFPGGSATDLFRSVTQTLYALPGDTVVHPGHDYPEGREVKSSATIDEHRLSNVAIPANSSEIEFVRWREERDAGLRAPKLLFQSVQVNINAGDLPDTEGERHYLKIPVNVFRPEVQDEQDFELGPVAAE